MEKLILDYTYADISPKWEDLREEFLREKDNLPFVKTLKEDWLSLIRSRLEGFSAKHLVVVGIGGSSLGAEALLRALLPVSFNSRGRRIFFFDNVDPERTAELAELVEPENTAFIIISKSGNTTETLANFLILYRKFPWKERYIVITGGGFLKEFARKEGFLTFPVPDYLPGRYSVLSPVGLVPFYLEGIEIEEIMQGAEEGLSLSGRPLYQNPALLSASAIFQNYQAGRNILVNLVYSEHLYPLGFWYRQLFSESLGKDGKGQTPVLDLGSVDQHSKLQLYLDGPDDKVYLFWRVRNFRKDENIDCQEGLEFCGKPLSHIIYSMALSTERALHESGRPTLAFELPKIKPRFLGQFITVLQSQVWFISKMQGVYPFDQPGVERMKRVAKEYIKGRSHSERRRTT